jgi:S-methylmethionine-dependent homocysteine/selenocysteine methylase
MRRYRNQLPQLHGGLFLGDGGLETTLIFHEHISLPHFAAFDLLKDEQGTKVLYRYYHRYAEVARANEVGVVLESPTWRANPDWAAKLGYGVDDLAITNRKSIELLEQVRAAFDSDGPPIVISRLLNY